MNTMSDLRHYLANRVEEGIRMPVLLWRFDRPLLAISSGPLGGGIGARSWVVNATVHKSYFRDDPDAHLVEIAASLDLTGTGVGLMTAVDVAERRHTTDGGVDAVTTVGLGVPTWAAAPDTMPYTPGTI